MKTLQKIALVMGLIGLLYSCQSTNQVLSKSDKKMEIMNKIANDDSMSKEMMGILMNSKSGKMMMKENHAKMIGMMKEDPEMMKSMMPEMMKMMEDNPEMMKGMMKGMMEKAKNDDAMMSDMCKSMMDNPEMMKMMEKMKAEKMDMSKMKGMDKKSK